MTNPNPTYSIPQDLLQAMVGMIGEMPARVSRNVLNAIEAECVRQDAERNAAPAAAPVKQVIKRGPRKPKPTAE